VKYRFLGATGVKVSTIALGTMGFGGDPERPYPHWFQRQFTDERFQRDGGLPAQAYRYDDSSDS
jgi:aryl-alcohol dehydrogenase-like predicted oxidoreductase